VPRPITQQNLGAWLLRCNPKNEPQLPQLIAGGGHRIERWCVADNYRSRMMAAGDAVVFWVSGDGRLLVRGIWGVGRVLGVGGFRLPPADDPLTRRHLVEAGERPRVSVDIPLLSMAVSDRQLRELGIDDLEVQRQPQGSNPSWISADQMARLAAAISGPFDCGDRLPRVQPDLAPRKRATAKSNVISTTIRARLGRR